MHRLQNLWEHLRTSLWFVPAWIVAANIVLALVLLDLEPPHDADSLAVRWPLLFGGSAEGCRGLLAAIAGSMITVAGVTFSITVVAMALASSQYTSRILRNFMRDRANQAVLGVFVGVFAYCLVVLRAVRSGDEGRFVPGFAVLGALLSAFVAIGFLIFFIHHIAASIQATSIIESAARETLTVIDRLFPARAGRSAPADGADDLPPPAANGARASVPAARSGYVQRVQTEVLVRLAEQRDLVVRMEKGIGEFVVEGAALVSVTGGHLGEEDTRQVQGAYTIGRHRTMAQDVSFGVRQIVDVALKALSPGINDTTTAISCIDYLEAILARVMTRAIEAIPSSAAPARARLQAIGPTFASLLGEAFDQIRSSAAGNLAVLLRILGALRSLAGRTADPGRIAAIRQQVDRLAEAATRTLPAPYERELVQQALVQVFEPDR